MLLQNSKLLGNFAIFCENGQTDLRLAEQIDIESGYWPDSIEARNPHSVQNVDFQLRNLQFIEIVNLSSEHEIQRFNFLVDLKGQSKHRDKNCLVRMNTKLFEVKNGKIETIFGFLDALNCDKI